MATGSKTPKKRALKGVIREIVPNGSTALISARINQKDMHIVSRLPKEEVKRLELRVGDTIDIFPINSKTYLIINSNHNIR